MDRKPLVYLEGDIGPLPIGDNLPIELDFHSGFSEILSSESFIIRSRKQSINFVMLTLDGNLTLDGDLWLA